MMKKCSYCRKDLLENSGIHCEKCKANEAKYGKPGICKYCQLPAAFLDARCVHCSHSERKNGPPIQCNKCCLKAAFPKHPSLKNKSILCRLCMLAHMPVSKSFKRTHEVSSSSHSKGPASSKQTSDSLSALVDYKRDSSNKKPKEVSLRLASAKKLRENADNSDINAEQILIIQQLKDNILELSQKIGVKEQIIFEKDKKIAELNAELLRKDKDFRTKISETQRQNENLVYELKEKIRNLSKELLQTQKAQKPQFSSSNTTS